MSAYIMPQRSLTAETDESQAQLPLFLSVHFTQAEIIAPAGAVDVPLLSRTRSSLASTLAVTPDSGFAPDCFSTGSPRMAAEWWRCCDCKNLVNPSLAPEDRCPICSHYRCPSCGQEDVR